MGKKDVAVVGVGYWGKNLARNYFELGALRAICDHHTDRLQEYQKKFDPVKVTDQFDEICLDTEVKKVVIAVPTKGHYDLAKQALLAGKDVFVEKAMCSNVDQAKELVSIAKEKGCILMVGHLLHYHPAIIKIKKMLSQKVIGDVYHCSLNRLNFGSVGAEESALWAFAPHDISLLLAFAGEQKIVEFNGRHKSFFSQRYTDQSWLHFEFEKGFSADIHVGWSYPYAERKLTLMGTKGMIVFDDLLGWDQKVSYSKNHITLESENIQFNSNAQEHVSLDIQEPLKEECKHFLDCCEQRREPLTSGSEGLEVIKVLQNAKELESTFLQN